MECNKERAIRAMEIAEKRLQNRDYAGAKKMALMAEELFEVQLDMISQLLTVSDVHCSAQLMANGLYDWYKILQVEPTSDENLIRKQYLKLARLLHPDKNKFYGAEAAFKLVGEAHNTLSDRTKRMVYDDLKRKHLMTNAAHQNSSSNFNWTKQQKLQLQHPSQSHVTYRCETPQPNVQNLHDYPDSEFCNFDRFLTCQDFQQGQIWALFSDLDTYPKYYGWIRKIEPQPFKVHINWLQACPKSDVERVWLGANLPMSCGKFKVTTQNTSYDDRSYFSHLVSVCFHGRGNYYEIFPAVGEIWAIYKNWSAGWKLHDLKTCKFDIVQIREKREGTIVVSPMKKVPMYKSVFMLEQKNTWKIPAIEYNMFSHKILASHLMIEQRGEKFKDFWELDPASVPYTFFNRNK